MPTYNVQADLTTGDIHVLGKDGRRYALDELEEAEAGAQRGDPAAAAILRAVDLSLDDSGQALTRDEVLALAAVSIDACPDCRPGVPP